MVVVFVLWRCLGAGKALRVLRVLPAHAAELTGRSARNVDRIRVTDSANIAINATTNVVYIVASEDSIGRITVWWCASV